tara:strand:+ start:90 stop:338 length:249 start_codon:yes stop_codon:yes gene_type:complete
MDNIYVTNKIIIMNVRLEIVKELAKFRERTSFYIEDYWGSKEQIKNEINIINELDKIINLDNEMKYNETIVEWYERMLKITK